MTMKVTHAPSLWPSWSLSNGAIPAVSGDLFKTSLNIIVWFAPSLTTKSRAKAKKIIPLAMKHLLWWCLVCCAWCCTNITELYSVPDNGFELSKRWKEREVSSSGVTFSPKNNQKQKKTTKQNKEIQTAPPQSDQTSYTGLKCTFQMSSIII